MNEHLYDCSGDEPMVSTAGMAVLMGVTLDELRDEIARQGGGSFVLPAEWVKAGRRRAKEYTAHTGRDDGRGAIDWWAEREGATK